MWLDNFFLSNITPLFFIETLADLEKNVRSGRTPEQVVGNLAYKTPDMQSSPSVHHIRLIQAELSGAGTIAMDGRIIRSGGKPVTLGRQTGVIFQKTEEEEAFYRWQSGEFLELDRQIAKGWRQALLDIDFEETYKFFQKWFQGEKPKTLPEVKSMAVAKIDGTDQEKELRLGMSLLAIPAKPQVEIIDRWRSAGSPAIHEFAPYFRHVLLVDLFFYLAIAADLISRERPSNKVDLAYLYYLPFCMVFASTDNLHARMIPLFLRDDQTFVRGADLKADLGKLNQLYSSLPDDVKVRGVSHFASYPPTDPSFLVTQLWDKHLPRWRKQAKRRIPRDMASDQALIGRINRVEKEAQAIDPDTPLTAHETQFVHIHRRVLAKKGKWERFPPEMKRAGQEPL